MSTGNSVCPSGPEGEQYEQNRRSELKVVLIPCKFIITVALLVLLLALGISFLCFGEFDSEYKRVHFSVVSLLISGLKPNAVASSRPVFHIVLRTEKAFKNSTESCLRRADISVLFDAIPIATTSEHVDNYYDCYNARETSEFVIPVPVPDTYESVNLRERLWNEIEHGKLDLNMKFVANYLPRNLYHVACNNLTLRTPAVPVSCDATMKIIIF